MIFREFFLTKSAAHLPQKSLVRNEHGTGNEIFLGILFVYKQNKCQRLRDLAELHMYQIFDFEYMVTTMVT